MNIPVYLEVGTKRTFAGAIDWPGWTRSGKDEASALDALLTYELRYATAVRHARLGFQAPNDVSEFTVIQRLRGDASTDFGTPGCIPHADLAPVDDAELRRFQSILRGCWRVLDEVRVAAQGKTLRVGPRGGGRDLPKMLEHILGGDQAYLSRLGVKLKVPEDAPLQTQLDECRDAILAGMAAATRGELPSKGPRGGMHWPVRYYVRRAAWHVLDHAWEIQDRLGPA